MLETEQLYSMLVPLWRPTAEPLHLETANEAEPGLLLSVKPAGTVDQR